MSDRSPRQEVLGVFAHTDALKRALERAREQELEIRDVYSPVPLEEVNHTLASGASPVRFFTFFGGLTGFAGGMALALLTSMVWNTVVGGKPVTSLVPFLVIGFEGTILFGAIGTLLGLLLSSRLPRLEGKPGSYREEFSRDRFGLVIACPADGAQKAVALLQDAGAERVETVTGPNTEVEP